MFLLCGPLPHGRGHRNATTAGAKQDRLSRLGALALINGIIQRHDDTRRTGVAPFVHNPMSLSDGLLEQLHHVFDGAQIELSEIELIDVIKDQVALIERTLHQFGPVFGIEGFGEFADEFNLGCAER